MSHRIIVITEATPSTAAATQEEPEFKVTVEYRPSDALTPAQIGNEVARVERRIKQIIEGTPGD